jgi:uncharacterized lipoprotein YddW (UPF0748 family)
MKVLRVLLVLLILALPHVSRSAAPEFRGVWVHGWASGLLSRSEVDDTVRWAHDSNMNALIVQVRRVGDAYYNSSIEPRASNIRDGADFDPLAYSIQTARSSGMGVHAWFNVFRVWSSAPKPTDPRYAVNAHPEWLTKDCDGCVQATDGEFLDPGVPAAREYIVKLVTDLLTKYDVDGVCLDFIRYPGKTWGYNDTAVALFNKEYGRTGKPAIDDPDWRQWRRDQVTATVRAIYAEAHRIRPGIMVSAATIAWGSCPEDFRKTSAYNHVFQDWRKWMQEGILDANMPMTYQDPADDKQSLWFHEWMAGLKRWSYGRHVYCGLMVTKGNVDGAVSQVRTVRESGLDGFVGFAWSQGADSTRAALAQKVKCGIFAKSAPVPTMAWTSSAAATGTR